MSDIVGGGIARGKGNNQVIVVFTGKLATTAEWEAFVAALLECAKAHNVNASVHPKQTAT